jgi:hypothetical protein
MILDAERTPCPLTLPARAQLHRFVAEHGGAHVKSEQVPLAHSRSSKQCAAGAFFCMQVPLPLLSQ